MIIKKRKPPAEIGEWRRVFKVLPVRTEDGHISFLGHVYKKMTGDVMRPVVYHTDPHGEEMKKLVDDIDTHVNNFLEMQLEETREEIEAVRPKRPPPPPAPPPPRRFDGKEQVCPDCGTVGCYKGPAKFSISGAGVLHAKSEDIMKSCKARQQLNALKKIKIGGYKYKGKPKVKA